MYPFSGKLINGYQSYQWLQEAIPQMSGQAFFCSAFLKANVLQELHRLAPVGAKVKVLSRWQLGDLIVGASDLSVYELCKEFSWDFYIKLNFHGKVFWVPESGILVGSANATSSGLGLRPNSNSEVGTVVTQSTDNINIVNGLFNDSVLVTDILFTNLKNIVDANEKQREKLSWPRSVLNEIEVTDYSLEKFFFSECLQTSGYDIFSGTNLRDESVIADLSLLGLLCGNLTKSSVIETFIAGKLFKWIYAVVKKNGGTLSFGGVTAALHDAFLEDPAPYRKDVKKLVQNLYSWIKLSGSDSTGIEVNQPNHSEVLRII
jgi:hypothetical protein